MKGYTQEHEEIENIIRHPEFEKVDLVSQFISELEKPALNKIEEIIVIFIYFSHKIFLINNKKNTKNRFKIIEEEYVDYQRKQENPDETDKKAFKLLNDGEDAPKARFDENIKDNSKILLDSDISNRIKKLMTTLKQSNIKSKKEKEITPATRQINAEKIRFEKNFKHFIKKKKFEFFFFLHM